MDWLLITFILVLLGGVAIVLEKCREWLTAGVGEDIPTTVDREREKLNGHWLAPRSSPEGEAAGAKAAHVKLFLIGRHFSVKWADNRFDQGTYQVDPAQKPSTIEFVVATGAHEGKTWPGIYRWRSDGLHLCCGRPGQERPTQFASDPERGWHMYFFVREGD
jgi:uncharacterized protein (TIGR03067 family)